MDVKRGREVVEQYRSLLHFLPKGEGPFDRDPTPREAMSHVRGMLDKMDEFLNETEDTLQALKMGYGEPGLIPDWDKFNRWLGFLQGVFWSQGTYTLDQMRDHNRT